MRRLVAALAIAGLVASVACTKVETDEEEVVQAVDATTTLAHRFTYEVEYDGVTTVVQGVVEDDFRYSMQVSTDAGPGFEQVVSDDAAAVRFLDPRLVEDFLDEAVSGDVDLETDIAGATVLDALAASRWVLDPAGAPAIVVGARDEEGGIGFTGDPAFDARTCLEYVRQLALALGSFRRYDPEALDPTYRGTEDPFAVPEEGSGVIRYDAPLIDLPAVRDATQGERPILPGYRNFRRMAVYVQDGRIIRVEEIVGLTPRMRDELIDYARNLLEQSGAGEPILDQFEAEVAELEADPERTEGFDRLLLEGINTFREVTGDPPLVFRTMTLDLQDFGDDTISVALPEEGVVRGNLAVLRNLGQKPAGATDEGPGSAGVIEGSPSVGSTPTTAGAGGGTPTTAGSGGGTPTSATTATTAPGG